jgi:hypothetical protein
MDPMMIMMLAQEAEKMKPSNKIVRPTDNPAPPQGADSNNQGGRDGAMQSLLGNQQPGIADNLMKMGRQQAAGKVSGLSAIFPGA